MSYHCKELTTTQTMAIYTSTIKPKSTKIAHLIVLKSPDGIAAQKFYPIKRQLILGRKSSDIALNDPKLSRQHFQIYTDGKHYYIKDLNSTNGTKVNGERIKEKKIHPKDIIESGDFRFEFNFPSVVPHRSKKILVAPSSFMMNTLLLIKTALITTLITLCAFLIYYSAINSFKKEVPRSPQSLNTERKGEGWSKTQAALFYQMACDAYSEGDYVQAQNFISQAKQFSRSLKFDSLDRAVRQALTLKETYLDTLKTREQKEKIEEELKQYFESAQNFIKDRQWDKAIISYQEALLVDKDNEEAKKGILTIEKFKESKENSRKQENDSSRALTLYQSINKIVTQGEELEEEGKISSAIEEYKKALSLAKKYEFNTHDITSHLLDAVNLLRDKTKSLWSAADTLCQAQKYAEAKEKIKELLYLNPSYVAAQEKKKELDQVLAHEAQRLYSQAVVYESLPDIAGAKEKWKTILTLLDSSHAYYKRAQQKLAHYSSY